MIISPPPFSGTAEQWIQAVPPLKRLEKKQGQSASVRGGLCVVVSFTIRNRLGVHTFLRTVLFTKGRPQRKPLADTWTTHTGDTSYSYKSVYSTTNAHFYSAGQRLQITTANEASTNTRCCCPHFSFHEQFNKWKFLSNYCWSCLWLQQGYFHSLSHRWKSNNFINRSINIFINSLNNLTSSFSCSIVIRIHGFVDSLNTFYVLTSTSIETFYNWRD